MALESLLELARTKPPEAILKIDSFSVASADATLVISTLPWWENSEKVYQVQIELNGLVELEYRPQFYSESEKKSAETAAFEVSSSDPLLLNYGPTATIYGNAPLPDPQRFLFDFYRLVVSKLKIGRDPVSYLNAKDGISQSGFAQSGISRWLEFVYSRSYCLLSAPEVVVAGAKELLDAQLAEYMILPDQKSEVTSQDLQVLKLGRSFAIFGSSSVELL